MLTLLAATLLGQSYYQGFGTYVQVPFDSRVGHDIAARRAYAMPVNPPLKIIVIPQIPVEGRVTRITKERIFLEDDVSFSYSMHMSFIPRFPRVGEKVLHQGPTVYMERAPYAAPAPRASDLQRDRPAVSTR